MRPMETDLALRAQLKRQGRDARPAPGTPVEAPKGSRRTKLVVRHRCVKCEKVVVLEAWVMDIWCQPIAPTSMPFPQVLQRDCECGGHANTHIALLPFAPGSGRQLPH